MIGDNNSTPEEVMVVLSALTRGDENVIESPAKYYPRVNVTS
jgi:hypothetical protein